MEAQPAGSLEPEKHWVSELHWTRDSLLPPLPPSAQDCRPLLSLPVLPCSGARKATCLSRFTGAQELHLNDHSDQMVTEGLGGWTKLMLQGDETLGNLEGRGRCVGEHGRGLHDSGP